VTSRAALLRARLAAAFARTDALFALVPDDALAARPIPLRHPLVFYLGHLPAFAWNQIGRGALGAGALDPTLDALFARGIDPPDEQAARAVAIDAWPSLEAIRAYRDEARRRVTDLVPDVLARDDDPLCAGGRVVELVVEHELMHHETWLYLLQAAAPGVVRPFADAPRPIGGEGRAAEPRRVPAGPITLGVDLDAVPFAWDAEVGRNVELVPAFNIDSLPARNRDWLAFLREAGAPDRLAPQAWTRGPAGLAVRTPLGPVPFELAEGWPVQVTSEQARAYAAARGGRLPTEAEVRRAALGEPGGGARRYPWGDAPPAARHGAFGLRTLAPVPVGSHTGTAFAPLPGFVAWARTYPGYSADFFDGAHDVVLGASFATDEALLRPSFRNWFRRDYPYAFTSVRVVRDD
jgi:formylglycine-generating enzyme required for sulfatase activity